MTAAGGGGSRNKMLLCLQECACRMGWALCRTPGRLMLPFKLQHPEGLKHLWRIQKTQPALPPLPQGFPVCISHGSAPAPELRLFRERGYAHLFCQGCCAFLKRVVASLGTHTHRRGSICRSHQPGCSGFHPRRGGSPCCSPLSSDHV